MFGSLSSCQPSSTVSTSFTATKNQSLVVTTLPVQVTGPNLYYITSTLSGFDVSTVNGSTGYVNPTIHLQHGRTYKFIVNSPNEPVYLTTTAGLPYTTGLRYVDSRPADYFSATGTYNSIYPSAAGQTSWTLGPATLPYTKFSVWFRPSGAISWTYLIPTTDYSYTVGASVVLNFPVTRGAGQLRVIQSKYVTSITGLSTNGYSVKVNNVLQQPVTDFVADSSDSTINFTYLVAANSLITVSTYEGQTGYFLFTPTASTPSVLKYRSRVSLSLIGDLSITANGTTIPANSNISLKTYETVTTRLTTPSNFLGYIFVEYFIDSLVNYFAVVNKNNYLPLIKSNDRKKRFFNYPNFDSFISAMELNSTKEVYISAGGLGFNYGRAYMPLEQAHIILDVPNSTVHFLNESRGVIRRSLELPDFPIGYEKYRYTSGGVSKTDVFVLCANGKIYRIDENLEFVSSQQFEPLVRTNAILDNLAISEDIPFKGSFTTNARRNFTSSLFPVVTKFVNFQNTALWLVGTNSIAKVPITNISAPFVVSSVPIDDIFELVAFNASGVIAITVFFDIYFIRTNNTVLSVPIPNHSTQLFPGKPVLGTPCTMPFGSGSRVAIPDAHNQRLIIITNLVITFLPLRDFVPAYCHRFGDDVYVTGHDSNRVYRIETINLSSFDPAVFARVTYYDFANKVTTVSVINNRIVAHHYLFNRTILDFAGTGIKKIVPFKLQYREGPVGAIGTRPETVVLLGESSVTPVAGPLINWYTNGKLKGDVLDYDYIGVSYRASVAGLHRSAIIIGEHAIDYDTTTINKENEGDFRDPISYGSNFMPSYPAFNMFYVEPWLAAGNYLMPFYINFYGTQFNEFKVDSNGVLTFDLGFNLFGVVPNFTNINANALLVEPREIYLDYPIDNRDVSNITRATLVGGKIPGVYYYSGVYGEFQFYKFKLIGTNPVPVPSGFLQKTITLNQTGSEFNFKSVYGVAIGQYVSNPITSPGPPYATITSSGPLVGTPSVQVVSITPGYSASVSGYYVAPGSNILYMTSSLATPIKKYSNITASSGTIKFGFYNGVTQDTFISGNAILSIDYVTNTIIVDGLVPATITNRWVFDIETTKDTTTKEASLAYDFSTIISANVITTSTATFYACDSITLLSAPFSPVLPKVANTLVQVSKTVFDNLFPGQKLTSTLYAGTETIVNKVIDAKTFRYVMSPRMAPEGFAIIGTLTTTNVNDGTVLDFTLLGTLSLADLDSDFTISYPGTAVPSFTIPKATSFSLPIYGNTVRISMITIIDAISNEFEDLKVRVSNLDPSSTQTLICPSGTGFGSVVNDNSFFPINSPLVGSTTVSIPIYFIELGTPYTTATSDIFYTEATKIKFLSSIPLSANVNTVVTYTSGSDLIPSTADDREITSYYTSVINFRKHELFSFFTGSLNYCCTPITWQFSGDFIEFDVPQTLPDETELLFKPFVSHYPIEYEVAFYVGRNFQFIEYNYRGLPEHDNTLTFGMRNAANTKKISISGTPTGVYSHLFGSSQTTGELRSLGPGSFTPIPQNAYLPRYPRIFRERVFDDTTLRYDVYIDSKIISIGLSSVVGQAAFTTPGTYSWVAPVGVDYVSVVAIGGGGGGGVSTGGGGGGGLGWKNNIPVVPGTSYTVVVGAGGSGAPAVTAGAGGASSVGSPGGNSYFISLTTVAGFGGGGGSTSTAAGGTFFGDSGGNGGTGGVGGPYGGGGGGAGGYAGSGGNGGDGIAGGAPPANVGTSGSGGAGGGGGPNYGDTIANGNFASSGGAGGGVGIYGVGTGGSVGGGVGIGGGGGSGGASGANGLGVAFLTPRPGGAGALYGGGAGGSGLGAFGGTLGGVSGGNGAVRIIWGTGRAFPGTNTTDMTATVVTLPSARVSLDYGYLRINDTMYDGTWDIKEGDILSLFIPFKNNQAASSVVLSIAGTQYALPALPNKSIINKVEQITALPGQQKIENVQITLTIPATGEYMIPDYFKSATGTGAAELIFERWVSGTYITNLARGAYHELGMGDEIIIKNIFTGYRDFNISEVILCGVQILRAQVRTINAPVLMNYVSFPVLDKPFTFQKTSGNLVVETAPIEFLNQPGFEVAANIGQFNPSLNNISFPTSGIDTEAFDLYRTRNIKVAVPGGTLGQPANLFVDNTTVKFIVNNVRTNSNYARVVSGDDISLEYWVTSYFASNVKLYQITNDAFDSSNIYTEVGIWPISNRTIGDALLINGLPGGGKSVQKVTIVNGGLGYDRDTISVTFSAPPSGQTAEGYAVLSNLGEVVAIILTNGGSGYLVPPIVTVNGSSTTVASATAVLVENLLSRETWLAIDFPNQFGNKNITIDETLKVSPVLETKNNNNYFFTEKQEPFIQKTQFPFFSGLMQVRFDRYSYSYLPNPIINKKESYITTFEKSVTHQSGTTGTFFTGKSAQEKTGISIMTANLAHQPKPLQFDPVPSKLRHVDYVISQGEILREKTSSKYVGPSTDVTGRIGHLYSGITIVIPAARIWATLFGATLFTSKNGYINTQISQFVSVIKPEYLKNGLLVTARTDSKLNKSTTQLNGQIAPNNKPVSYTSSFASLKGNSKPVTYENYRFDLSGKLQKLTLLQASAPKGFVVKFVPYQNKMFGDYVKQVSGLQSRNDGRHIPTVLDLKIQSEGKFYTETRFNSRNDGEYVESSTEFKGYNSQEHIGPVTSLYLDQLGDYYKLGGVVYANNQPLWSEVATSFYPKNDESYQPNDVREFAAPIAELQPVTIFTPNIAGQYEMNNPIESPVYISVENLKFSEFYHLPEGEFLPPATQIDVIRESELLKNNHNNFDRFSEYLQNSMWLQARFSEYLQNNINQMPRFSEYLQNNINQIPRFSEYLQNLPNLIERFSQYLQNSVLYKQLYSSLNINNPFFREIDSLLVKDNIIGRSMSAEYLGQDKLFRDFNPEMISQDKLFRDFNPETISQDKLFRDFNPEQLPSGSREQLLEAAVADSGHRNFDLPAQLGESGGRNFDLPAQLDDSGNRNFDFSAELDDSGNRNFDFLPERLLPTDRGIQQEFKLNDPKNIDLELYKSLLTDPGNRYLDFLPELERHGFELPLTPELERHGIFVPFPPEVLSPTPNIIPLDWVKFNPDVDFYQDDTFNQGAFESNIRVVADDGRAGDYGQFHGSPPGTPGRSKLPLIPYRDFQGSALLSKTTNYGFGGFATQNDAALIAAKYISAGAFQIIGTDIWNYRIYFGRQMFKVRKSQVFPRLWYIRGA